MGSPGAVVSSVRFTRAGARDEARGLLGWVSFTYGPFRFDSVAVRRTRDGRTHLSFQRGRGKLPPVFPLHGAARREIERQVFGAIGVDEGGPRTRRPSHSTGHGASPGPDPDRERGPSR